MTLPHLGVSSIKCPDVAYNKCSPCEILETRRRYSSVQDEWIWIELHGVREHDRGWLYDGKAELMAFEKKRSFIILMRDDLIKLVEQLVDLNATVYDAKAARYKVYSRPGRPDKITMIETEKLAGIRWDEWPKS